ncbi:MAG TPA: tetratricopeptide repeat protein [Pyrinomonadaceae bacterium]
MNCIVRRLLPAVLLPVCVLTFEGPAGGQQDNASVVATRPAITVLDSTKEQDGLVGSVRRVKTETARIALKDGRPIEGPPQLVELTTYGIKGNRIENTSYPTDSGVVGKEEYKYDEHGNITEMTVRNDRGAILNREAYGYEFDKFGNWTKMVTSLVVFENGELKREPVEVTYRTLTYYFDDTIAKAVEEPKPVTVTAPAIPEAANVALKQQPVLDLSVPSTPPASGDIGFEPPRLSKSTKSVESVAEKSVELVAEPKAAANTDANESFFAARELLDQKKDREATKAFKESIKLNPNFAEAHYGLGIANFRLARFREAVDAFKKATTLDPNMAKAHYGLSLAYQELGMERQLVDEFRILERLDKTLAKKLAQTFPQSNLSCRLTQGCW